jgi:hypothetical protein
LSERLRFIHPGRSENQSGRGEESRRFFAAPRMKHGNAMQSLIRIIYTPHPAELRQS